jgi:hypothetical protein
MGNTKPYEYFNQHYLADFKVFGGNVLCAWEIGPLRSRQYKGLEEFIVCQFWLNLLDQAVSRHAYRFITPWREFSQPLASVSACSHHGYDTPYWYLKCMQEPVADNVGRSCSYLSPPISLTWEMLSAFAKFFLDEYLAIFMQTDAGAAFSQKSFLEALSRDADCKACVFTPVGREDKHIMGVMRLEG